MDHLVNRYHHMDEVTAPGSIDLSKWKNYLDSRAEFAAVCKRCIDEQVRCVGVAIGPSSYRTCVCARVFRRRCAMH